MKKLDLFKNTFLLLILNLCVLSFIRSQEAIDSTKLTIDRIFQSGEFRMERFGPYKWLGEGDYYTTLESSDSISGARDIIRYYSKTSERNILIPAWKLIPEDSERPLRISNYFWSADQKKLLIFTNTRRVWRANTRGDYWIFDLETGELNQLGKTLPESSLMFAKFSQDGTKVTYVSNNNLYMEGIDNDSIRQLTFDGTEDIINGTFDWAYEEEFACRDGFRWSGDGKYLAFWQLDASDISDFLMINNTDSIYSYIIPVQYPKVGKDPSACKLGVVNIETGDITWMDIPGDTKQHYLPRMQWVGNSGQLLVQQLNRKQNTNRLWLCDAINGTAKNFYTEEDSAWIEIQHPDIAQPGLAATDVYFLENEKEFIWISEKDGWRHLYLITTDGQKEILLTDGEYDIASLYGVDEKKGWIYFNASPENSTQRYLYRVPLKGSGKLEKVTPDDQTGVNRYDIAPGKKYAVLRTSNANTPPATYLVSIPKHHIIKTLAGNDSYLKKMDQLDLGPVEFFQVTTTDGIDMDGYIIKPPDFDPDKKYPVLFYVYGEPWGQTATDTWSRLWYQMLAQNGYLVISMDNRGTPCLKGREWRKSIYGKVGVINSRDQAMAAKEILKWDFVDPERIAVWGWSGGGSMTLNLMFRYPEIYKTGLAVAPVSDLLYYDNIYQERYSGVPWEFEEEYKEGSPVNFAKNLEGNLLIVHGTGDDNVHYQNTEALINELIKNNKMFQVMPYPNRSHGIYEGRNTRRHLFTLLINYLMDHTQPGGK